MRQYHAMRWIDDEWLTKSGRAVRATPPPEGLLTRLKLVAGLVAAAPSPAVASPRLLWRNERRVVVSLAVPKELVIGRDAGCDLTFSDSRLSRRHCRVRLVDGATWVEDLGSTHGTLVNDRRVRRARLRDGDVVSIGSQSLAFVA